MQGVFHKETRRPMLNGALNRRDAKGTRRQESGAAVKSTVWARPPVFLRVPDRSEAVDS